MFLVNLPIGAVAVLLARRRLAESRAPGRRQIPDLPGSLLFAIAIAALVLGIVKGQEWGWGSARIIGSFSVALATGAAVIWRCTWHRSPIIDLSLLKPKFPLSQPAESPIVPETRQNMPAKRPSVVM